MGFLSEDGGGGGRKKREWIEGGGSERKLIQTKKVNGQKGCDGRKATRRKKRICQDQAK